MSTKNLLNSLDKILVNGIRSDNKIELQKKIRNSDKLFSSFENITLITYFDNSSKCQNNVGDILCQSLATPNVLIARTNSSSIVPNLSARSYNCDTSKSFGYIATNITGNALTTSVVNKVTGNNSVGGYFLNECDIIKNSNLVFMKIILF